MMLIDTNAVLRYILNDIPEQYVKVREYIAMSPVIVRYEVIAEAVFVLMGVYKLPRADVAETLKNFISTKNVHSENPNVLWAALGIFAEKNLDFVDCVLCAFSIVNGYGVLSFDKKLNALLSLSMDN